MLTLMLALLGALLLGASWEGTIKAHGVVAACSFVRLGRLRLAAVTYRPGRVYIKMGIA